MKKIKVKKRQLKIKLRKKVLGHHAKGVIYDTENGMILAPIDDYTIGRYLGFKGGWNISEIKELLTYIKEDDTVYVLHTAAEGVVPTIIKAGEIGWRTFTWAGFKISFDPRKTAALI